MNKFETKWRWAASSDELSRVKQIDKELNRLRYLCKNLSGERREITNRCGVRANERGL